MGFGMTLMNEEEGGWGCGGGGKKGEEPNRGRMIERVIANDCCFHCSRAQRHSRGSDRHNLFLCKSLFRGSHSNALRIFTLPPAPRLLPEFP